MKPNIFLLTIKLPLLKTLTIILISSPIPSTGTSPSPPCNTTCGEHKLNYPFGFSPSCPVQLNCTPEDNTVLLSNNFRVQSLTNDTIVVDLPVACDRPVKTLTGLFGPNYAPSWNNAILLQNCSPAHTASTCFLPTTTVETNFELHDCGAKNQTVSCYSENMTFSGYVNYTKILHSGCGTLFSAISMVRDGSTSSFENGSGTWISLDVQVVRLGWWVNGECSCDRNAKCVRVAPFSDGSDGLLKAAHRCECIEGYVGDGFRGGLGCRKESACNPSKYLSGKCGGTTRVVVLVGGVIAGAALMIIMALIFLYIRKKSKLRARAKKTEELSKKTNITIPIYPYKEMEKATDHFSDKRRLGNGSYGTVYLGKLNGEEWVAIKRIKQRDHIDSIEQALNEIKILSCVSHPNLVKLLGCCVEHDEQILVYEYMPNGTLAQHLQREKGDGGTLQWPVRLAIACETAQAISYLHNATTPPIYHRDVKSSNILLDYDYKSKVADFGLSRLGLIESSHISTAPQGTPGYLDPQYHQHFHLSDKSDVYSFGVVLLEIVTGLKAVDFDRAQDEVNLASLAVDRIGKGRLDEIVDPSLEKTLDEWTVESIHKVGELAFRCLAFHRDARPSMVEVAIELEQIRSSRWVVAGSGLSNVGSCSRNCGSMDSSDVKMVGSVDGSWTDRSSSPGSSSLLSNAV